MQGFFVEGGAPGLTIGPREKLMGLRALPTHPLALENVRRWLDGKSVRKVVVVPDKLVNIVAG